jgi:hypothetical protein
MAKLPNYIVEDDKKFPWVKLITINSNEPINLMDENFNITVKDQLDFFIQDYIKDGDTFDLEELFKKDTEPTVEISLQSKQHVKETCFTCRGEGIITCPVCNGTGDYYPPIGPGQGCSNCGGSGMIGTPDYVQGAGVIPCTSCGGDGYQRTICDDEIMVNEKLIDTIGKYNNSSDKHLIDNGIQFWIDGSNSRKLYIRIVTKGKSTTNVSGYQYWDEDIHDFYPTYYVGFTVANFNITLNETERLNFNVFLIPTLHSGDPQKVDPTEEDKVQKLPDGEIRTDYIWNDNGQGKNNLYVNNAYPEKLISAYSYQQASAIPNKWFVEGPENLTSYPTPLYELKSSAYLNDYLMDEYTKDLITGEMSARGFNIVSSNFNSYLYDEYSKKQIELPLDMSDLNSEDTIYISASNGCVSGTLYWYEMTQTIINSADDTAKIRKNQVKLELKI